MEEPGAYDYYSCLENVAQGRGEVEGGKLLYLESTWNTELTGFIAAQDTEYVQGREGSQGECQGSEQAGEWGRHSS